MRYPPHPADGTKKSELRVLQINLGDLCNQACAHCHMEGSPSGRKTMTRETAEKVAGKITGMDVSAIEFTGGAPELNPNLPFLIETLAGAGKELTLRSNLTALELPDSRGLIKLFAARKVGLMASLPSCRRAVTDSQRGDGAFDRSIRGLKRLNDAGYGSPGTGLSVKLVHNPAGPELPREACLLQAEYETELAPYGVFFDGVVPMANVPVNRFRRKLEEAGNLEEYIRMLVDNYNPCTLPGVMCRDLLSVDYGGRVYDCDFNLALGRRVKGYEDALFWEIDFSDFSPSVSCDEHCYACTAGAGSSCRGALAKEAPPAYESVTDGVKLYYGEVLRKTGDLKTGACCPGGPALPHIAEILPLIADEVKDRYYGCGSPIPSALEGLDILDLGCGTGRDTYVLSKLAGENGRVYGLDMTEAQVRTAVRYQGYHAGRFGFKKPNTAFVHDYIENMDRHFGEGSLDLVISNCVINLVEDKGSVLAKVHKCLKEGGELYFSDIYADRRLPEEVRKDPVLYGECLGGALYYRDFPEIAAAAGFPSARIVSERVVPIGAPELKKKAGGAVFFSVTFRLWKIVGLERGEEDWGDRAVYMGGMPGAEDRFDLDRENRFLKSEPVNVSRNTALMLSRTRLARYFRVCPGPGHAGAFTPP